MILRYYEMLINIGPTQSGELRFFLPADSGSNTNPYSFSEIIRAEKSEFHPFV